MHLNKSPRHFDSEFYFIEIINFQDFFLLTVNAIPTLYTFSYRSIFGRNSLASYWSGQQALASRICKLYVGIIDHWPILRCLGLLKPQKQVSQLLSLGNYIPHWITVVTIAKMVGSTHCKLKAYFSH